MNAVSAIRTTARLSAVTLAALPRAVTVPRYAREQLGCGIVHIGLGNFHRAHQALYLDELFQRRGPADWAICGVGLLPQDRAMAEALACQDHLYTLVEREREMQRLRVIGSVIDYVHAPTHPQTVLARLTDPTTRIVSLTITESGYYLDQHSGELDVEHPALRQDLALTGRPTSVYGYLVEALARRRRAGIAPFTVQSCDNLQGNGDVVKRLLSCFARLRDARLGDWIEANVAFPNSMIDRITPATTEPLRLEVREALGGIEDVCPVMSESFRHWVIEDEFVSGRPAYETVGVQFTSDVRPYERMKIHMLNGSHQALAHVGALMGYETVDAAMQDRRIVALLNRYMDAVRGLIEPPSGMDLRAYQCSVIQRFGNPAIKDRLARIRFDASSRIPKFVLPMMRRQLERGGSLAPFAFVIACWIRCLGGRDDTGRPILIEDPMAAALQEKAPCGIGDPAPFLALAKVFGADLAMTPPFVSAVAEALRSLNDQGTRAALERYSGE